jgi:acetyl-CoA C-acetyltransferase
MPNARPVAILGGVRIPFCRQNTAYADVGNLGMSVRTLGALVERFGLQGQQLGEVAMGAVIKHSSDWNLGREATLSSGLSPLTPGITAARLRHLAGQHRPRRQQDRAGPDRLGHRRRF